jgi:serine/threonine protein kinase
MQDPPPGESTTELLRLRRRADPDALRRQADAVGANPIVKALLDWVDGYALVLNVNRQLVAANEAVLCALGCERLDEVLGQRVGEVLGCVYAAAEGAECGAETGCDHCGALRAVEQSSEHKAPTEDEYRVTTRAGDEELTRKFRTRATPLEIGGQSFTALFLQLGSTQPHVPEELEASTAATEWPPALRRYTRLRPLGSGGMGTVYLVADDAGHQFALKFVNVPERASPGFASSIRQRFRLETEVGLNLHHPNIVGVLESGATVDGTFYFVSEFCPFGSTSVHLQRVGTFPIDAALFWMIGAARGLEYAWREHRIVHRDIKPDNLLIGDGYLLKIADFGIAQRKGREGERTLGLTSPGMVVGSARYMAPEQAYAPNDVDDRSDLYSLGATFYHLLCGSPPFAGANAIQIMMHHAESPLVPLCARQPGLPLGLGEIVDSLLAKRRVERPSGAAELRARLEELAATLGVDPDRPPENATLVAPADVATARLSWAPPEGPAPATAVTVTRSPSSPTTTRELRPGRKTDV